MTRRDTHTQLLTSRHAYILFFTDVEKKTAYNEGTCTVRNTWRFPPATVPHNTAVGVFREHVSIYTSHHSINKLFDLFFLLFMSKQAYYRRTLSEAL